MGRLHEVLETELCPLAERVVKKPGDCPSDACVIGLFSIESSNSEPVVAAQSSLNSHVPTTATTAKGRAVEAVLVLTIILGLSNMLGFLDLAKQERNMAMKRAQRAGIHLTPAKPALSLVMANLAKLVEGDAVLDPCCGTGSLLLAARQHLDCLAICADVAPDSSPLGGGNRAVALRADFAVLGPYRSSVVDAILADPPFGLREDLADGEFSIRDSRTESRCHPCDWTPEQLWSRLCTMALKPLLKMARELLLPGKRLVFLVPVFESQRALGLFFDFKSEAVRTGMMGSCSTSSGEQLWGHAKFAPHGSNTFSSHSVAHMLPAMDGMRLVSVTPTPCRSRRMQRLIVCIEKD